MFNVEKVTNDLIIWIQNWFEENGKGCNAIIGISGGKEQYNRSCTTHSEDEKPQEEDDGEQTPPMPWEWWRGA